MISPVDNDRYVQSYFLLEKKHLELLFSICKTENYRKIGVVSGLVRNLFFNRRLVMPTIQPHISTYVNLLTVIRDPRTLLNHLKNI